MYALGDRISAHPSSAHRPLWKANGSGRSPFYSPSPINLSNTLWRTLIVRQSLTRHCNILHRVFDVHIEMNSIARSFPHLIILRAVSLLDSKSLSLREQHFAGTEASVRMGWEARSPLVWCGCQSLNMPKRPTILRHLYFLGHAMRTGAMLTNEKDTVSDSPSLDMAVLGKMQLDEFAKAAWIVVIDSLGISESFQDWAREERRKSGLADMYGMYVRVILWASCHPTQGWNSLLRKPLKHWKLQLRNASKTKLIKVIQTWRTLQSISNAFVWKP